MEDKSPTGSSGKDSRPNNSKPIQQFTIEVDRPGQKLDMQYIKELLNHTGIKLDPHYGPYLVNPKLGHYVVRGTGDVDAQQAAEKIPGVKLFPKIRIEPT